MKILSENQLRKSIKNQLIKMIHEANVLLKEEKPKEEKIPDAQLAGSLRKNAKAIAAAIPGKFNDNFARLLNALQVMAEHDPSAFTRVEKMILKYDDKAVAEDKEEGGDKEGQVADSAAAAGSKKKSDFKWKD